MSTVSLRFADECGPAEKRGPSEALMTCGVAAAGLEAVQKPVPFNDQLTSGCGKLGLSRLLHATHGRLGVQPPQRRHCSSG